MSLKIGLCQLQQNVDPCFIKTQYSFYLFTFSIYKNSFYLFRGFIVPISSVGMLKQNFMLSFYIIKEIYIDWCTFSSVLYNNLLSTPTEHLILALKRVSCWPSGQCEDWSLKTGNQLINWLSPLSITIHSEHICCPWFMVLYDWCIPSETLTDKAQGKWN